MGGAGTTQFLTARDKQSWAKLWRMAGHESPPRPLGGEEIAVAIHLGERRSSGFAVHLIQIEPAFKSAAVTVIYRENHPKTKDFSLTVITNPWLIVTLPRTEHAIAFLNADTSFRTMPSNEFERLGDQIIQRDNLLSLCRNDASKLRDEAEYRLRMLTEELDEIYTRCQPGRRPITPLGD
jgi:hypothetical protein